MNPASFWTHVARLGMQYGLPAVRAILNQIPGQQPTPQMAGPQGAPQQQPVPMGAKA
ncbi:hypothetical protein AB0K48_25120 [Nonomuraea sp. NPDC055795]